MDEYEFILDLEHLEIFPPEIYNDPYVVFHGTTQLYSENIESNGLVIGHTPYDVAEVRELLDIFRNPTFGNEEILIHRIETYLDNATHNRIPLSFTYLSYKATFFAYGLDKGGKALAKIRYLRGVIQNAILLNPELKTVINPPINNLFNFIERVDASDGVIYAIRLRENLEGIFHNVGNIFSRTSIPRELIIGKIIVPAEIEIPENNMAKINYYNARKLSRPGKILSLLG